MQKRFHPDSTPVIVSDEGVISLMGRVVSDHPSWPDGEIFELEMTEAQLREIAEWAWFIIWCRAADEVAAHADEVAQS